MLFFAWKEIGRKVFSLLRYELRGFPILEMMIEWIIGCILIYLLYRLFEKKCDERKDNANRKLWMWLYVYSCFVINLTILRREPGSRGEINLQLELGNPFIDHGGRRAFCYAILNGLLFIPFGYLLRKIEPGGKQNSVWTVMLLCMAITLAIEIIQLFTGRGNFELTDLVMNFIGGCFGMIIVQSNLQKTERGNRK